MPDDLPKLTIEHVVQVRIQRTDPTVYPKVAVLRDTSGAEQAVRAASTSAASARVSLLRRGEVVEAAPAPVFMRGEAGEVLRILELLSESPLGVSMTVSIAGDPAGDDDARSTG